MKELKVGERVVLDIVETETMTCEGCFFDSKDVCEVEKNIHAQGDIAQTVKM